MQKTKLKNKLKTVGLTDKEASVYLAGLELGPATVSQLAKQAQTQRTTTYLIIEALEKKGLMSIIFKGMKRYFVSEDPKTLNNLLKYQQQELDLCIDELSSIFHASENKSSIKYYRDIPSIRSAYEWILKKLQPKDEYLVFGNLQAWYESDPQFFENWPKRRQKIIRHGRSIYEDSEIARTYLKYEKNLNTNVKILPQQTSVSAIKLISSEFVLIHQTGTPSMAIIIENRTVAKMYKEMFEIMWKILPKI